MVSFSGVREQPYGQKAPKGDGISVPGVAHKPPGSGLEVEIQYIEEKGFARGTPGSDPRIEVLYFYSTVASGAASTQPFLQFPVSVLHFPRGDTRILVVSLSLLNQT